MKQFIIYNRLGCRTTHALNSNLALKQAESLTESSVTLLADFIEPTQILHVAYPAASAA